MNNLRWSQNDLLLLRKNAAFGMPVLLALFPERKKQAIYSKASSLSLKIARPPLKYSRNGAELENKKWAWEERIRPVLKPTSSGCLEWFGSNSKGYGQIRIFSEGVRRLFSTHRIAWEVANGQIIGPSLCVLHRCDNPRCNNSDHLFVGTNKDNGADRHAKGRTRGKLFTKGQAPSANQVHGIKSPFAKLDDDKVREARGIYASGRMGHKLLARKYGVSPRTMHKLVKRKSWTHVK